MGNNVSCAVDVIFMHMIEDEILTQLAGKVILWKRYIDDIFPVYRDVNADDLLALSNDIHPNIASTLESPSAGTSSHLDILVSIDGSIFSYTLFSKSARSAHVIPWDSCHPRSLLRNVLRNDMQSVLLRRVLTLSELKRV